MAQKQFKIGLSNTDKQNMAQDVYERLLALTFPEYDTTESYEIGDFVVYNDQLYKCIGATSGAWDSTKWQLATLNDLLTDIESAVAFVNDKANVDGNYPTMTVGMADNLTPYDESAGDDQDEPFSFQATGTGNGTQPDFATGSAGLMKEKQGNTVVVNQLVKNGDFSNGANSWGHGTNTSSITVTNGVARVEAIDAETVGNKYMDCTAFTIVNGHKYLLAFTSKTDDSNFVIVLQRRSPWAALIVKSLTGSTTTTQNYVIFEPTTTEDDNAKLSFTFDHAGASYLELSDVAFIDLTQWFNGDIPQDILDNPSNFFRYYQGSLAYNEGTLVNANGRYIKCIGMNQWDEEWEEGVYDTSSGEKATYSSRIRSKNYIKIIPNADYYFKCPASPYSLQVLFYDKDKKYIGWTVAANNVKTTPSNCCFITFNVAGGNISSYSNDISINLYYEDEPRCLTYEPYQVLTNNDTGVEVLRSAGSVADIKLPSGEIKRNVGVVDLGTLTWNYETSPAEPDAPNVRVFYAQVSDAKGNWETYGITQVCAKYPSVPLNQTTRWKTGQSACRFGASSTNINIYDPAFANMSGADVKSALSGVYLFYELAEPTTEQGTPYSENLVIDDFGSMDFDSDVPQGANIFYPVDYKAFVDTLYKYTTGTPSNIALKSDLSADKTELQGVDTQLKNALGGTLRNILALDDNVDFLNTDFIDLGSDTLSYAKTNYGDKNGFYTQSLASAIKSSSKCVCTKFAYQSNDSTFNNNNVDLEITISSIGWIKIKCNAYTDATAFKNAMKGVLLAYEKASE